MAVDGNQGEGVLAELPTPSRRTILRAWLQPWLSDYWPGWEASSFTDSDGRKQRSPLDMTSQIP